jgi:hypothetical protein
MHIYENTIITISLIGISQIWRNSIPSKNIMIDEHMMRHIVFVFGTKNMLQGIMIWVQITVTHR